MTIKCVSTHSQASKLKQQMHSLTGSCQELIKAVRQRSDLVWAQGLVSRVETALTQVMSIADQSPFNNDFLCMDSKDIRKKYGDEEAGWGSRSSVSRSRRWCRHVSRRARNSFRICE